MEGMETSNVTPDTAVDTSVDVSQDSESTESAPNPGSTAKRNAPTQAEQSKIKAQIRELGDADMDALVKVKVNGVEKKVSVRDAIKISQLEQASHQKMQEAAKLQRQFQDFARQAKDNPDLFFEQFGIDADQYSEARLAKKLEQLSLSPEQKKARDMEMRLKHYEEQEKTQKEQAENQRKSAEETRAAQSLDQEITAAFKASNLPRDPFYVQLMAAQMLSAERRNEPITALQAAEAVKQRFSTHVNSILGSMDADAILSFLGEPVRKKMRDAELRRVTHKAPPTVDSAAPRKESNGSTSGSNSQKPNKPLNEREFRAWLKNR